jgi:hypothetical protein
MSHLESNAWETRYATIAISYKCITSSLHKNLWVV